MEEREFLISELLRFNEENGRLPRHRDMCTHNGYPSQHMYDKEFGSWNNAIDEAFNSRKICKEPTETEREFLVRELLRFKNENGRKPFQKDMCPSNNYPSYYMYKKEFGSWKNAIEEVFGTDKTYNEPYVKERKFLISELLRFKEENGRVPKSRDMGAFNGYPSQHTYHQEFGSWSNAINEAFNARKVCKDSGTEEREFLISELLRFNEENGRIPKERDMTVSKGYPCVDRYRKEFGSWPNARKEAFPGLKIKEKYFLIEELQRFQEENGRIPSYEDMRRSNGYPNGWTYIKEFGSFSNACNEAFNLQKKEVTKDFLIEELKRFQRENDRIPLYEDMKAYNGYPSKGMYIKEFGYWENAIKIAFPDETKEITREFLIEEFLRFQTENERIPINTDMQLSKGYPPSKQYCKEFGSWQNAVDTILDNNKMNEYFFSPENMNLQKWYIVGYIIGDGTINSRPDRPQRALSITTTEKDKDNLYDMHRYMEIDTPIYFKPEPKHPQWQSSYSIIKSSKQWCDDLALYGIVPNKSLISYIPLDYLKTPEEEAAIMRGIFDSDGSIGVKSTYQKTKFPYLKTYDPGFQIFGSKQLCENYAYLLKKNLGLTCGIYPKKNICVMQANGKQKCQKVYDFLYGHENFFIKRKKERFEQLLNGKFTKENDPYYS